MTSTQEKPVPVAVENPQNIGDLPRVPEFELKKRKRNENHRVKLQAKTKLQIAKAVRSRRQPKAVNVSVVLSLAHLYCFVPQTWGKISVKFTT